MLSYEKADYVAYVGKREYYLSEEQYQFMKKVASTGQSIVWFDDFTLSIPHMSDLKKIEKKDKFLPAPAIESPQLTEEERQKNIERLAELKHVLSKKNIGITEMTPKQEDERREFLRKQAESLKEDE